MSDELSQVLTRLDTFRTELRQDLKDMRQELKDDMQRTRHDIRDELGGRVTLAEKRVDDHERETAERFEKIEDREEKRDERIRQLEKSKWTLAGAASAVSAGATAVGSKLLGGGG